MTDKPGSEDVISEACDVLGDIRAGKLQVKIADHDEQIDEAQALRYRVFVEQMGAGASDEMHAIKRDQDKYDPLCDHLLVLEHAPDESRPPQVVGTYRLLRRAALPPGEAFYTASEFDISAVLNTGQNIMELGRSCVHEDYRNRAVMQLLWRGIGAYIARHDIALMFGCASLHGTDLQTHAATLSYLHHAHLAPEEYRLVALKERYHAMDIIPKDKLDERAAFTSLPALVKGYLRLGGYVGDGAVIDHEYNTTDVGIVVRTELVTEKYVSRYGNKSS